MTTEQFDQLSARITVTEILVSRMLSIIYRKDRNGLSEAYQVMERLLDELPDPDEPNLDPKARAIRKGVRSALNAFKLRLHSQLYNRSSSPDWTAADITAELKAYTHEPYDGE